MAATTSVHRRRCYSRGCEVLMAWLLPSTRGAPFSIVLPGASAGSTGSSGAATHRARPCGSRGAYGGSVAAVLEMSRLLGGSRAAARGGAARLRPTIVLVKTTKEDTMATTLLDYRDMMAELHIDDLLREAAADRKVQATRAARRQRRV